MLMVLVMLLSLGLQAFAEERLYCRMCGKQIPADSKVCQFCGEKVIYPDQSAAPATPAPITQTAEPAAAAPVAAEQPVLAAAELVPSAAGTAPSVAVKTGPSPATAVAPGPFSTTFAAAGTPSKVRVTKSPTSESVPYGGSCSFIAHAANATTITWYIASADSSIISTAADAPRNVSGLYVSGANSDTLYLSGIPSWMNGCQVQACFDGEGGPVYTDIARIWTYQPSQAYNGVCWWDWFKYYYECDPNYWDYPWYWYNYWLLNPVKAPCWFCPDPDPRPICPDPKPRPICPDPKPQPICPNPEPVFSDPTPGEPVRTTYRLYSRDEEEFNGLSGLLTGSRGSDAGYGRFGKDECSAEDRGILDLVIDYNTERYTYDEPQNSRSIPEVIHSDPVPRGGAAVGLIY